MAALGDISINRGEIVRSVDDNCDNSRFRFLLAPRGSTIGSKATTARQLGDGPAERKALVQSDAILPLTPVSGDASFLRYFEQRPLGVVLSPWMHPRKRKQCAFCRHCEFLVCRRIARAGNLCGGSWARFYAVIGYG